MLEQLGVTRAQPADQPGLVGEPVTLVEMRSRRALAVLAARADGERITELVRALDAEPGEQARTLRMIRLSQAEAGALAATLREMLSAGQVEGAAPAAALAEQVRRLNMLTGNPNRPDLELDLSQPIQIVADAQTNSLLVASSEENAAAMELLVEAMDTLPMGEAVVVRFFPLSNSDAQRIRGVVDELFRQGERLISAPGFNRRTRSTTATGQALAGQVALSVDARTNALIAAGSEDAIALVEVLVKELDRADGQSWVEPVIVPLEHADAARLAATLRAVLVEGVQDDLGAEGMRQQLVRLRVAMQGRDPEGPGGRLESEIRAPMSTLIIHAEEELNALLIVGASANIRAVTELVKMLDVEGASATSSVRMYPLEHASADRVASLVRDLFRDRERTGVSRPEDSLVVQADTRTNTLVVATSPRSFTILDNVVKSLDSDEARQTVALHVLPVKDMDVRQLAGTIQNLMRDRIQAAQRSGAVETAEDVFTVEADPAGENLIIAASAENLQVVRDLIESLARGDEPAVEPSGRGLVQVVTMSASDMAETIDSLYVSPENQRRGERAVTVVPSDRLNALIVAGTQRDVAEIRRLVEQLDTAQVTTEQHMQRIQLRSANALEVVNLLETVLAGRPVTGADPRQARLATVVKFYRPRLEEAVEQEQGPMVSQAELDNAIRSQIKLVPERRTNSITVLAPPSAMGLIKDIIADLDRSDPWGRKIETFRLNNADARQMATVLQNMFQLEQQGNRLYLVPRPRTADEVAEAGGDPFINTHLEAAPDERQQLAITIDVRTNTLLVSATEEYLERIRGIVEFLDSIDATERDQFVYEFRNAKALEVERVLQSYFQAEAETISRRLGGSQGALGSMQTLLEREVTVVGDQDSNKLLVQASPRYIETVRRLVEELDSAPPQVKIQVLLAEVTVDDSNTWGVDFDIKEFGGDMYTLSSVATGAGVATAIGLPNLHLNSEDFGLVVRALTVQGKLEVLSKPEVTVNNNQTAFLQVGENVTLPSGTTQSGETIRVLTERRDIGILLNVTPSISSDGFVRMEISPEISSVSSRTTQVSQDFEAPIITQRRVDTTVTVRDGQTVIIGGLIQNTQEIRETKVPLLGDIPGLGQLFRTRNRENVKTELLVILTPRVVPGGIDTVAGRLNVGDLRRYDEGAGKVFGALQREGLADQLERELIDAGYGIIEDKRGRTILVEPIDQPPARGDGPHGPPAPGAQAPPDEGSRETPLATGLSREDSAP